jgi:hypothetical protein
MVDMGLGTNGNRLLRFRVAAAVCALLCMASEGICGKGVTVTGEGVTEGEALRDAIDKAFDPLLEAYRPALGKKGQVYDWTRRVVAAGGPYVLNGHYKQLSHIRPERNPGKRVWEVTIDANLPKDVFEAAWREAEEFVESIEEPTVGIAMEGDWVEDTRFNPPTKRLEPTFAVRQAIKEALHKQRFIVKILDHTSALRETQLEFAKLDGLKLKSLTEIALRQGADLLISADARTLGPRASERTPGVTKWDWEAFCNASIFWTDDATELGTLHETGFSDGKDQQVGRIYSLQNAGENLANAFLDKVFEQWSDWAYEGGTVTLTVTGTNFSAVTKIKKVIKGLPGVIRVTSPKSAREVAEFRFRTKHTAQTMAELLDAAKFPDFRLEIDGATMRTITAAVRR